ncbi:calmodulin-binding transcription activator 5 [Euphorbia lathyris]|uniref:calmodulin-binding transcription activator 5 n=1 Tax=Euphorbia lathyris TaxID=212925 RepID=UPI00331413BE
MESVVPGQLVRSEIHGFHTLQDLDFGIIMEEARTRWLRPNEIHAILCNYKYFTIHVKPMHLPRSGLIVLFDRKKLRNFRRDGHNWKKKKDGKTVKEAHEHLKVGNEERIHVYYAHGEDNPTFVRRCYWLLDKTLEHIVLVHYRETQELQGSPVTPINSNSSSASEKSRLFSEEFDSGVGTAYYAGNEECLGPGNSVTVVNHEMRLHELNTLEWEELVQNDPNNSANLRGDKIIGIAQQIQTAANGSLNYGRVFPGYNYSAEISPLDSRTEKTSSNNSHFNGQANALVQPTSFHANLNVVNDGLESQDSFGRWIDDIISDSPGAIDNHLLESSTTSPHELSSSSVIDQLQSTVPGEVFFITEISPAWAFSTETTKVLFTGYFHEQYRHLANSDLFCICGDARVPAEIVQDGVYRCFVSSHSPGLVNMFLSLDGHKPISQVLNFEFRISWHGSLVSSEDNPNWEKFKLQIRLTQLLATSKKLDILTRKVPPATLMEAKKFMQKTSEISHGWTRLMKLIEHTRLSPAEAKDGIFELTLRNMLKEWLVERIVEGCKTTVYDSQGLGVIHLCSILGYTWSIHLYLRAGLSLDFRDKHGWTALHWAAFYGREKMVVDLLSAGAKPNLVTDPTKQDPSGCMPADLATRAGHEGLGAFLAEKALVAQLEAMQIAGNASGQLQTTATEIVKPENLTEEEMNLKDTLTAYRTAAGAAACIQAAFRDHSFKLQTRVVENDNTEDEARNIVAAMKIQHAFRNYENRKKLHAAARIQHGFRAWKLRREFINLRRQAIKIQAAFRGFQARRHYRKIIWSVGVLEKVILRWRLKRKGFRGLCPDPPTEADLDLRQESDAEEDFFKASRKQAEERVERAVVTVQSMFRSKQAQAEYRRMKLAHNEAQLEYEGLEDKYIDID